MALLLANVVVLALAVTTLAFGRTAPVPQQFLDAPLAAPGDWFDAQRAIGGDRSAYARAIEQANATDAIDAEWTLLGPTNIGGRVADLAIDPKADDTVYIAAASGGVWKSTDAAVTFTRAWPDDVTQAVGALAAGSDGTLWAGTGEASPGGGSIVYGGTGIYKSTDGGATWERSGLPNSGAFGRIVVHPNDPDTIFAAAAGNLFVPGGQRGLYRSTDGGAEWERVLAGPNDTTGAVDISIDPSNPDNLLVSLWDHYRTPAERIYAGEGSGVYRSTDGGTTWTRAADVTMPDPADNGRIGVAFSPADPKRAYAIIANRLNGTYGTFFRSDDGGVTWTELSPSSGSMSQSSFGWWFGRVFPDPDQVDRLFVPGVSLVASSNGGETFSSAGVSVHADQHAMAWDPKVPGRVYLGNDGGAYRSDNDAAAFTGATDQGWTQHYSVDVGETSGNLVITGLQDNGCVKVTSNGAETQGDWASAGSCGDGLATLINPVLEARTYTCSQYGGCSRQLAGLPDPLYTKPAGSRFGWFTPFEFDPTNPDVMYFGSDKVHRTITGGTVWETISPDLSGGPEQTDPHSGYRIRGVVTAIGVSRSDPNTIYAGTDNGRLWITRDLGETWTDLTDNPALPQGAWITRVTVDRADAAVAYVTYSGYRGGSDAPHVLVTRDAGATWDDLTQNLPHAPVNDVVQVRDTIAVATDVGVFLRRPSGEWARLGSNLPTVPVLDLRWHQATGTLTAATFGHGIQRVTVP